MKSKRNGFWNISVFALLLAVLTFISIGCASADTIYVPEGGNQTIQAAVNNASEIDTIIVRDGTYNENVNVNVAHLTIRSQNGTANCIVNTSDSGDHVFEVTKDYVNISGFTVENATGSRKAGIYLGSGVEHCNISDNIASNNHNGIYLSSSSNNTLTGNTASNNYDGIRLSHSSNNTLMSNTISENKYNFGVSGSSLSHFIQSIDTSNLVDGKPIYYWVNQQDKQVPNDAGFVGVVNSTNVTVRDLTLTKNREGVLFAYTTNSVIESVNASNNYDGINLCYSSKNTITSNNASNNDYSIYLLSSSNNNTITDNTANSNNCYGICLCYSSNNTITSNNASSNYDGILLSSSSNNTLTGNTVSNNYWCGIYILDDSSNNLIYCNNLINNTNYNVYDISTNQWNTSSKGNYYSDYTGSDNNSDGIGDTSYQIPGGSSIDYLPLIHPWEEPPLKGDLDGDNQITSKDAAIALQIAVGSRPFDNVADMNGDGRVSSLDALIILQTAAWVISL